jgi:hypothetical protein
MLPFLAAPLLGGLLNNIFNHNHNHGHHGHHGHHGDHGCHNHNNRREAAQDFRMAREDFRDAQQDFARGDIFGGLQELADARQHMEDGFSHLGGRQYY